MLAFLGFGKKHKSSRKVSRKGRKARGSKKPPAKLLKMCKKLKIKATMKRGSKRVYKSSRVLLKQCKKKLKMLKKRKAKMAKSSRKTSKKVKKTRRKPRKMAVGRSRFSFGATCGASNMAGSHMMPDGTMMANRDMMFGAYKKSKMNMEFGAPRRIKFGNYAAGNGMEFGKGRRRATKKVSKASAMKAFKEFYRRHCKASMMGRSRFGSSNPPLYQSMGYEFCGFGSGGVLGANSTGLFASPCTTTNRAQAGREMNVKLGTRYSGSDEAAAKARGMTQGQLDYGAGERTQRTICAENPNDPRCLAGFGKRRLRVTKKKPVIKRRKLTKRKLMPKRRKSKIGAKKSSTGRRRPARV